MLFSSRPHSLVQERVLSLKAILILVFSAVASPCAAQSSGIETLSEEM